MFKFVCWLKMIETSDQYFWRFLLLRLQGLPSRNHFTICWLFPEPVTLKWAKNWCKSAILGWNPDMFTWKLHKQKCVSCLFVAEVWVLQKHMQRDSYTLSHDQWIQCDLAVKIWEFWRLRGPARKWITWRSNWRCSAERSFHWLLFWMHHVLTIPGRLFSWFSWHQFFFPNKIWCGSMYFFICNYLESKRFWYTNWILTHGVSNVAPRKLEEKLGSKLDGEELLPVVKGPASSFDELIELLSSKNGNKNGKPLKKRYKMRIYIYIYT